MMSINRLLLLITIVSLFSQNNFEISKHSYISRLNDLLFYMASNILHM